MLSFLFEARFERALNHFGIQFIEIETWVDNGGEVHRPRERKLYSLEDGTIQKMPMELKREIFMALQLREAQVQLTHQIGSTLQVSIGKRTR